MGQHEGPLPGQAGGSFWGTTRLLARLPAMFLVMLLVTLIGLGILAVMIGNAYGAVWGALISAGVAPIVGSRLLRGGRRRSDPTAEPGVRAVRHDRPADARHRCDR
jgi:hypothetical protein